jgi:hypothetical protein
MRHPKCAIFGLRDFLAGAVTIPMAKLFGLLSFWGAKLFGLLSLWGAKLFGVLSFLGRAAREVVATPRKLLIQLAPSKSIGRTQPIGLVLRPSPNLFQSLRVRGIV